MTVERLLKRSLITAHIQAGQQAAKLAKKCRYMRMAQEKNNSQVLDHIDQAKKKIGVNTCSCIKTGFF